MPPIIQTAVLVPSASESFVAAFFRGGRGALKTGTMQSGLAQRTSLPAAATGMKPAVSHIGQTTGIGRTALRCFTTGTAFAVTSSSTSNGFSSSAIVCPIGLRPPGGPAGLAAPDGAVFPDEAGGVAGASTWGFFGEPAGGEDAAAGLEGLGGTPPFIGAPQKGQIVSSSSRTD